jgi:predicted nucleic acid-binding protein
MTVVIDTNVVIQAMAAAPYGLRLRNEERVKLPLSAC